MFSIMQWVVLGWFGIFLVIVSSKYRFKDKLAEAIWISSPERKEKQTRFYSIAVKYYIIFFWFSPLYLAGAPYAAYVYYRADFIFCFVLTLILFIILVEDFLIKRWVLAKLREYEAMPYEEPTEEDAGEVPTGMGT